MNKNKWETWEEREERHIKEFIHDWIMLAIGGLIGLMIVILIGLIFG